jgi:peroxiredoxin
VELRQALANQDDLVVVYVMAANQVNAKTLRFLDELGLRDRIRFARDEGSAAIDALGLRKPNPETIEAGVPHPATYVLDRDGVVRFVDVREDFHVWVDPQDVLAVLAKLP